jgi:carboxymethylenebutenolidase
MTVRRFGWLVPLALLLAACGGSESPSPSEAADQMAEAHEGDSPQATAAAREPMIPVEGRPVMYFNPEMGGDPITGYMAEPVRPDSVLEARGLNPDEARLPGLIVIHEWWGLNDNIRTATRRLAGEGYRALAVDLYSGGQASDPSGARALMEQALQNKDLLMSNLAAAHEYLREDTGASRVGVLGWCFGGGMALQAAVAQPEALDAAVIYYGSVGDVDRSDLAPIDVPILGLFGGEDQNIPVEQVRAFEEMLADLGKDARIHVYQDAGHAFANPSGERYNAEAAADAWDKTTAFLQETLYGSAGSSASADASR